ncbi:MAG: hypothetical protein WD273_12735 [Trueperaceae bacterium]
MNRLLFLFIDGVGLASADPSRNPFAAAQTPFLRELLGGKLTAEQKERKGEVVLRRLDATLDHPGLPQSATGQASLLTGTNCATVMGRHYGPWPGPTLRRLLERGTLFSEVVTAGGGALLANAYPPGYFEALRSGRAKSNVPVHSALRAGLELADLGAYSRGEAIAADLTGEYFATVDSSLPVFGPQVAGERLSRLARGANFTFFDFWLSDRVGHRGSFHEAVRLVENLDRFMAGVADALDGLTLLITSDHGNLEDKGVKGHTRAPVPLLAIGPESFQFAGCASLLDVAPAVRRALTLPAGEPPGER